MKKTALTVLILSVITSVLLILPSCGTSTDPMAKYTPDYEGLSEKEIEIRKVADAAITEEYGFTNLANYRISMRKSSNARSDAHDIVFYTLMLHGVKTKESYTVHVKDLEVIEINGDYGEYVEYLSRVSKRDVEKAVDQLSEKFGVEVTKEECYFEIKNDQLSICCEKIISTGDGDHRHSMKSVIIG